MKKMNLLSRIVLSCVMCMVALGAMAQSEFDFVVDRFAYRINADQLTVSVTKYEVWDESIGLGAYVNMYLGMRFVDIPESVTHDGQTYPVTGIDPWSFLTCDLETLTLPNSMKTIGESAFESCHKLSSISMGESVTTIGNKAFQLCTQLTDLVIPNSVTTIGNQAFNECSGLKSLKIGNSVTHIGQWAFQECSLLTELVIPNSVITIEDEAFRGCESLTKVTIPNSVKELGGSLFDFCGDISDIYCYITRPDQVTMGWKVFKGVPTSTCVLHVPKQTKTLYQQADQWKEFVNIDESLEVQMDPWIALDKTEAVIHVREELQLTATTHPAGQQVSWSSSNNAVATVDANGMVKAVAAGNATITAKCGELTATCAVTVIPQEVNPDLDVNHDGEVNIADVNAVINGLLGK